jgi:hypothetical protein
MNPPTYNWIQKLFIFKNDPSKLNILKSHYLKGYVAFFPMEKLSIELKYLHNLLS